MNVDISNKVIVITGASKGIGKELAYHLSKEGANVVINYIAQRLHESKEAIYRGYIKDYGESTTLCMLTKAVDRYKEIWSKKGLGWFCESMPSKIPNCTNVMAYYGSSVYDTKQMNRLIDAVIADCEELNISYEVDGYELTQGKR